MSVKITKTITRLEAMETILEFLYTDISNARLSEILENLSVFKSENYYITDNPKEV